MGEHDVRQRAVFLDRDGVINKPVIRDGLPFPPKDVNAFELYEDVVDGCARLEAAGYLLVVVTNQPDVARGTQTREVVEAMNRKMQEALPKIARVEVCWHSGDEENPCDCRKPKPGMILQAAKALDINPSESFLVGDRWKDIECGHNAGCRTIFIDHGYSETMRQQPDYRVESFSEAVAVILRQGTAVSKPPS